MISEAALCMVTDRDRLPSAGGVLPPAAAFGDVIIEKLVAQGHSFSQASRHLAHFALGLVFGEEEEPSPKL